jgi:hypothetical protein
MKLSEFKAILARQPDSSIFFVLPTGTKIPPHAHVTDVARVDKRFIDCGGVFRTESVCRMQIWFADDTDHRVGARMLLKVLDKAAVFLETDSLEIDEEYEAPFISQFPILRVEASNDSLLVHLGIKHTTCLAEDRCLPPPRPETLVFRPLPKIEQPQKCC